MELRGVLWRSNPSGALALSSNGTTPASSSASYSTSWTPPAVGSYYWTATYSGDGNYLRSEEDTSEPQAHLNIEPPPPPATKEAEPNTRRTVGPVSSGGGHA